MLFPLGLHSLRLVPVSNGDAVVMWRVGIAWSSPLMLMKRVRRGCTFEHMPPQGLHTAFPQSTFLTIPIMLKTRRDMTRRPCRQIVIWPPLHIRRTGGRARISVARGLPMTASSCLGVDLNLSIKADPSVLQHPPPFLAIPAIAWAGIAVTSSNA